MSKNEVEFPFCKKNENRLMEIWKYAIWLYGAFIISKYAIMTLLQLIVTEHP